MEKYIIAPNTTQTPPSESIPSTSLPQKPKLNIVKLLILVGIIVLLLISGVAGFAYFKQQSETDKVVPPLPPTVTQTPNDPTANWKTYRNNEYEFAFMYPGDYEIQSETQYETLWKSTSKNNGAIEDQMSIQSEYEPYEQIKVGSTVQLGNSSFPITRVDSQGSIVTLKYKVTTYTLECAVTNCFIWVARFGIRDKYFELIRITANKNWRQIEEQIISTLDFNYITPTATPMQFMLSPLTNNFVNKKFSGLLPYPSELTSPSDTSILCSKKDEVVNTLPNTLKNFPHYISSFISQKNPHMIQICEKESMSFILYEYKGGGGGSNNTAHLSISQDKTNFIDITDFERESAYFECVFLAYTNNNIYLECGGGDVGFSKSLYKVNSEQKVKTRLVQCYTEWSKDGSNQVFNICKNQDNDEILRTKSGLSDL
ncbi:MAG TPA: hypothetical protein PLD54_01385 [Candidatus Levybacteria bacterium]|nr:hypothetical protein [Candidatus Levybacteria bacterium]